MVANNNDKETSKQDSVQETIAKSSFVELDYTGFADGQVFDTTLPEVARQNNLTSNPETLKPLIVPVGFQYLLTGLDEFLIGKTLGEFKVSIPPEKAFGDKKPELLKLYSLSSFKSFNIKPEPGLQVNIDGFLGVVKQVGSGRVLVDFNHPLAGKPITYELKVKRFVTDNNEKLAALINLHGLEALTKNFKIENNEALIVFNKASLENLNKAFESFNDKELLSHLLENPEIALFSKRVKELLSLTPKFEIA
ncbi:peptidylprolyl isomerase [Candidatus Woesearchaeota archaeon]|nr:peptidylprolyl isomerase [Candidatus Woesearchaeota archaeon]